MKEKKERKQREREVGVRERRSPSGMARGDNCAVVFR
jgi:hypothetical protein